jgi:ribose transport system ATP-binding protein
VADRATVFRDGRVAATVDRSEITHGSLVDLILGTKGAQILETLEHSAGRTSVIATAKGVSGGPIQNASFTLHEREVVGVAGLLGSGRSSLLRMLFGAAPLTAGKLELAGQPVRFSSPQQAIDAGVGFVPEDRLTDAAFVDLSVMENLGIANTGHYFRGGRLRMRAERRDAREVVKRYLIKTPSLESPLTAVSGGNQQKVMLARWMQRRPRLLLLDEPTQGVDVGARAEIWQLVRRAVDDGAAALVVSSDMEELSRVCDRVLVLHHGRIVNELAGDELTEEKLDHLILTGSEVAA